MTQCRVMRPIASAALILAICFLRLALAQPPRASVPAGADDPVAVFTEHPRLFLRPARLRLLQRERERNSIRWQQFDGFVSGDAPLPESAFAHALYYQVSGSAAYGHRAIAWALSSGTDLRQLAVVFDWCQKLLTETERRDLTARIERRMAETAADESISAVRSRVLAAVALFDVVPQVPNRELERVVRNWWGQKMAPALVAGRSVIPREDAFAFWELLHALRDSTNIDLRESCARCFKEFPVEHLLSHYPPTYQGEENDFHIPASRKIGQPDLSLAAFSRVAELAMVAYDTNAEESQYLQGWLMHDNFMLRGVLGAPYEFLWANPYQPGLSFTLLPLIYHNAETGRLFVRSNWEESADWFGYFDGVAQLFRDGRITPLDLGSTTAPLQLDSAVIYFGPSATTFRVTLEEDQEAVILAGLAPRRIYLVEIDDEEVFEEATDPGGILVLDLLHGKEVGVRLREKRQ
jgi:hypothetical protein